MNDGFLLGAGTALAWGVTDVLVTRYTRRIGFFRALLVIHGLSLIPLVAVALFVPQAVPAGVSLTQCAVAAALGPLAVLAYIGFYRALELGPIAIVSPIVSSYGALVVLCALVLLGESLGPLHIVGCLMVFCCVALASVELGAGNKAGATGTRSGIKLSVLAAGAFGAYLFLLARLSADLGWLLPILLNRATSVALLFAWMIARPPPAVGKLGWLGVLGCAATGLLDAIGYVLFNRGGEIGEVALTGAASSAYPLIPIAVGLLALRERVAWHQLVGIAGVVAGMVILSLG
jgi:drug/metabolite transporter (DMT)-like permease